MRIIKRILLGLLIIIVLVVTLFIYFIGPRSVYEDSQWASAEYYAQAQQAIAEHAQASDYTNSPGKLQVGWAHREITVPVGTPLAGYGARGANNVSTGYRDAIEVEALALGDGKDTVIIVGADMLITPPTLSSGVRERVTAQTPLTPDDILFNASHTHCGPGAFMEGMIAETSAGPYDAAVLEELVTKYTEAIMEAYKGLEQATFATNSVDAPEYIRNRTREAAVDSELSFIVFEKESGDRCYLISYSAHPTIFSDDMMQFSAEYPGELRRYIEKQGEQPQAIYLGGAVGSMGPHAPQADTADGRVVAMGQALAKLVLDNTTDLEFSDEADIASLGIPVTMPEAQVRPASTSWRLSPKFTDFMGLDREGWLHGVRLGDTLFMGMPCDFSGEISREWKAWASVKDIDLWCLSFCSTYCGYFSPDRYYLSENPPDYEMGLMNWYGPNVEAYYTALFHHTVDALQFPEAPSALQSAQTTP